jgi:hypothetical protein
MAFAFVDRTFDDIRGWGTGRRRARDFENMPGPTVVRLVQSQSHKFGWQ